MKRNFAIFTHVIHSKSGDRYYAYTPYVREMNIWLKFVEQVEIVAPLQQFKDQTDEYYRHDNLIFSAIPSINFLNPGAALNSLVRIPTILRRIFSAMRRADHLHIRCPGNIGLLACLVQIFFPKKPKTVKYAGNWDPKSEQALSYRFQKWILNNPILTRNAKVLVYGNWPKTGKNILPFFTSSFSETDKLALSKNFKAPFRFIFTGNLVEGKRPLFCIQLIHELYKAGCNLKLDIYGRGPQENLLNNYVEAHQLHNLIYFHGNQPIALLKEVYKDAHFSLLPSKSEGWPKAIAEAMFFGCVPVATSISCVPWMLDFGKRGILIEPELDSAAKKLISYIEQPDSLKKMSEKAMSWSQQYTLEKFGSEIQKLL